MQVHHHIKYKEIHGVDEVVVMDKGEHRKLHNRLRKENKCNIPPTDLCKISARANSRVYRKEHREEHSAHNRAYAKEHKEKCAMYTRAFRMRNRTSNIRPDIIAAVI